MTRRPPIRSLAVALAIAMLLAATPPAGARAATTSSNWAGYAAHRTGVTFREASATWRQPTGSCASTTESYSAFWVGIGGYREGSDALEQIGTELDCASDGVARQTAWYELVPAASRRIRLTVQAGDRLHAAVSIDGDRVTLSLQDLTRGTAFARTVTDHDLDQGSAEWITEAPSDCRGSACAVLPLADFGTVDFLRADAATVGGERAVASAGDWTRTRITLGASEQSAAAGNVVSVTHVTATPSALTARSGAFSVAYAATTSTTSGGGGSGPAPIGPGGAPPTAAVRARG